MSGESVTEAEAAWVVNGCGDRCEDYEIHEHFARASAFRWCWPKVDTGLRAAQRITKVALNRYPHHVIGAAIYVRGHGLGVRWKR